MSDKLIIVNDNEPVLKSWARDTFTFGALATAVWFTNTQIAASGWINFFVGLSWFLWLLGKSTKHRVTKTPEQARAWLDENFPESAA